MRYTIKSGVLYSDTTEKILARIKSTIVGSEKKIECGKDLSSWRTEIRYVDPQKNHSADVRNKQYLMHDSSEHILLLGLPCYAPNDDPDVTGWPICRMPRVDHANITIEKSNYILTMHNSQNYSLLDKNNTEVLRILHKGIAGGWILEDNTYFPHEILCGIFIFCRYIEQENEFLIV